MSAMMNPEEKETKKAEIFESRVETPIIVSTVEGKRFQGMLHLPKNQRISDYVNKSNVPFLALTNISYLNPETNKIEKLDFLLINKSHIITISNVIS